MGAVWIEYIADLGPEVALRIVSSSDRYLAFETKAPNKERIATVELATGGVTFSETELASGET